MQQHTRNGQATTTNTPPPTGKLTVSLIPESNDVHVGDNLKVTAEVLGSNNDQLRTGQCELDWSDSATNWTLPTRCGPGATERSVADPGVHHITVKAVGSAALTPEASTRLPSPSAAEGR